MQKSPQNITVINTRLYYKTNQSVLDILRRTSGIKIRTNGGFGAKADFYINGISGKQIKFFLDGVPLSALGETQGINLIPLEQTSSIEIYKGVIPVFLGSDALGGAINMVSRNENKNFLDISTAIGSYGTTKSNINARKFLTQHYYLGISGSYNRSANDYRVSVEVPNEFGNPQTRNVRRFHNQFKFYNAKFQTGWINTRWADDLSVTGQLSHTYDQIQNNVIMTQPYGQAYNEDNLSGGVLHYKKRDVFKNVHINGYGSFYRVKGFFADTTLNVYNWEGKIVDRRAMGGEISTSGNLLTSSSNVFNTQQSVSWQAVEHVILSASNTYQQYFRNGNDPFSSSFYGFDFYGNPQKMRKNVSGVSAESKLLKGRLINITSLKFYNASFGGNKLVDDASIPISQSIHKAGYNTAFTYFLKEQLFLKASYEKAVRLPDETEAFGDLMLLKPNPGLVPELSDNFNFNVVLNSEFVDFEATGFHRSIENIIYLRSTQFSAQYQNLLKANITGFEFSTRIRPHKMVKVESNLTFQDIRNQSTVENAGINNERYMGARLPNIPYLFANAAITFTKDNVLNKSSLIQFYWNCNYTNSYFLYWAVDGDKTLKNIIPTQFVNNLGLSLTHHKSGLSFSADASNIFNNMLYDNFKVQLPGRNYSLKLRYYISKNRT
ncbi:MAG: TonB-dependent receptor [Dyadobacter sp.]|uniref:TonB-dependent receptor domain-containing protein n=1 Tax=Dyadobacter sp. TaxID=1914288 RepID=UPI0032655752